MANFDFGKWWRVHRKGVIVVIGAIGVAASAIPNAPAWVTTVLAVGTAVGVWQVPNERPEVFNKPNASPTETGHAG